MKMRENRISAALRNKKELPKLNDIKRRCHVAASEKSLKHGALREAKEEIGITLAPKDIHAIGILKIASNLGVFSEREFQHFFIAHSPIPLSEMRFDDGEASGIYAAKIAEALKLFSKETNQLSMDGYRLENGEMTPHKITVAREDFVPHFEGYYFKTCICARQFLKGERYITI